ncbi:MAG: hypothetical protein ACYC4L_21805 [Chloroflexota bacterium]
MRDQIADAGNRRLAGLLLLGLTTAYLLLAVLPFYGHGIHLRSLQEIGGSFVDPKGYAPFVWFTPLAGIGVLVAGYLLPVSLALVPLLALGLKWGTPARGERALWLGTIAFNVASLAATWPARSLIGMWLAD